MTWLVDATALASGHKWRGIGTYVRHLVRGIAEAAPDSAAFLTLDDGAAVPSAISLLTRPPDRWADLWPLYSGRLRRILRVGGFSMYHFTSPEASIAAAAVKTIGTVYDLIPLERPGAITLDARAVWRRAVYRSFVGNLRRADHLIAISAATAGDMKKRLGIPADRITVIPLGIDRADYLRRATGMGPEVRRRYDLPERYWLTVTSPNPNKGWPDLLRGLRDARDAGSAVPLVIAGHWLPKQRLSLERAAEALQVDRLVRFVGYVDDEALPALYAEALGFLFASHREGFGLPVLEAQAVGTPVITADDPAVLEITQDTALTFRRGDAAELALRMLALEKSSGLRETLGARGSSRSELYTWDRTVTETLAVYEQVSGRL